MIKNRLFINDKLRVPITNCCNFSCFYCHNEGQLHKQESSFMSLDFIKGLKSFITKNNVYIDELNITGGEPLLHPNLLEIVALLKNVSNNLCIITNGSLLTKQKIDDLIKVGITKFKFGIDTLLGEQTKLNIKHTKNDTQNLIELIKYTQIKLNNTQINVVVVEENYNEIDSFINFAIQNHISCINFIELINCGFREKDYIRNSTPKVEHILDKLDKTFIETIQNDDNRIIFKYKNVLIKLSKDFCNNKVCHNTYTVLHENEIVLCHKYHNNYQFDINQVSLVELKNVIKSYICPDSNKKERRF